MNRIYPKAPEIFSTIDYESFKFAHFNRDINSANLEKLEKLNRKEFKLHLFPILCSKDKTIIDGQHRFSLAKKLGAPVYYIIQDLDGVSVKDVYSVNVAGKKHTISDKLEMLYKDGDIEIKGIYKLYEFYEKKFRVSDIAMLCAGNSSSGHILQMIDSGEYKPTNIKTAVEILTALSESTIFKTYSSRNIFAIAWVLSVNNVSCKELFQRLQMNRHLLLDYAGRKDVVRNICDTFNYRLTVANHIHPTRK